MRPDLPQYVQVLMALRDKLQKRQRYLEGRTGSGLENQEYQRHVGRIAEVKVSVGEVDEFIKHGLEYADELLEEIDREQQERRSKKSRA